MENNAVLVVGAGFSGAVVARELAESGFMVHVIEQRDHVGGNAYDYKNHLGILVHKYGPHLFHTSNLKVVEWLSRFTSWMDYPHKVKAMLSNGQLVTLPVNAQTAEIVGQENIIDVLYRPYTKKMWGLDIEQLDPSILNRVPVRSDDNELYFPNDAFQALPSRGYTALFENILDHDNIKISLNTPFQKKWEDDYVHVFNCMPIDAYFNYELGHLPYRSIKFHHLSLPTAQALPVATVNFTDHGPYTRITEWKHLPNNDYSGPGTSLTLEEPCDYRDNHFERFYPVKDVSGANLELYKKYKARCAPNMTFMGRCGLYAYLDMHQAISSALSTAHKFLSLQLEV